MRVKFWTISLFVGIAVQISLVSAVECDGDDQCVKTEFTTNKCESKICKCIDGYLPTDWGCTKSLDKPTVTTQPENNAEAFDAASVTVTCEVDTTETHTFKWFEDGSDTEIAGQSEKDYTFTMGTANKELQCSVFAGGLEVSEKSDGLTIKLLPAPTGGATTASDAKAKISLPSPGVAQGKNFIPTCTGYPYGLNTGTEIKFTDGTNDVSTPIAQPTDAANKEIKCKFEKTGFTFSGESELIKYPNLITTFESVTITSDKGAQTAFKQLESPTLTCETLPNQQYLPDIPTYSWNQDSTPDDRVWQVPQSKKVYKGVTCTAEESGGTEKTSEAIEILTVDDDYLAEPSVTVSPKAPFKEGQLTLTCNTDEEVDDILWKRDGVDIPGQKDKIIQYTKLDADFKATCSVRKNGFSRDSSEVDINIADDDYLAVPSVTVSPKAPFKQGQLTLTCNTDEEVDDVLWTIDGDLIPGQKDKIIQYTKLDADFKATCSVRKDGFTRESSEVDVNIAGQIPTDLSKSIFIALPKKPGATECELHRTISLMSHITKILLKIIMLRIRNKIKPEIAEEQCGFVEDKGTSNAIYILRTLIERALEVQKMYICVSLITSKLLTEYATMR
ncbi:hypothetical protein PoB_001666900 [Plakobranchus ocellatus]|uniref:Ig-like domain-containing protein n=1 Tax=Plakobranchus ocellatus TaxID=259542 RepID=A0AAV3Z4D7_9GAST|nr:hypothetical protein PoB_001666900 [Plakobranchus ocellatus]